MGKTMEELASERLELLWERDKLELERGNRALRQRISAMGCGQTPGMKVDALIRDLKNIRARYGNIPVQIQDNGEIPESNEFFFIIPEQYSDGWRRVSIRTWPY